MRTLSARVGRAPQTLNLLLDLGGVRQIWVSLEQVLQLPSRGLWLVPAQMDLGQQHLRMREMRRIDLFGGREVFLGRVELA